MINSPKVDIIKIKTFCDINHTIKKVKRKPSE